MVVFFPFPDSQHSPPTESWRRGELPSDTHISGYVGLWGGSPPTCPLYALRHASGWMGKPGLQLSSTLLPGEEGVGLT